VTPRYPAGTVGALLKSDHVLPPTREALRERLERLAVVAPRFFDGAGFATLRAVCARLIPQPERERPIDIASGIDTRLADGGGDGWRYDALPSDGEAYRLGLRGLDELAGDRHGAAFAALGGAEQDGVLSAVQSGQAWSGVWGTMPPDRFFEELLAEATEIYYAHPLAQEKIGYVGMADLPGWTRIGLDELEEREPRLVDDP